MKSGKTIVELAKEIQRRSDAKADFVAPSKKLSVLADSQGGAPALALNLSGQGAFPINNHAHSQLATYLDIPKRYYDRMVEEAPGLLAMSANRWLEDHGKESRMVRTLDGRVRALLSDRYRPLENEQLAEAVLPVLNELQVDIMSADVTDTRFYLKAVDRNREEAVQQAFDEAGLENGKGHDILDVFSPAITIQNSEVGSGSLQVNTSVFTQACTNLAVWDGDAFRKYHIGRRADISSNVYAMLTDRTKEVSDQALFLQARDITRAAFDEAQFSARIDKIRVAQSDRPIEDDVVQVVEKTAKRFTLNKGERSSVLEHLIKGGQLNAYGMSSAITRASADVESYDRASEMEKMGAQVIELSKSDWTRLAAG